MRILHRPLLATFLPLLLIAAPARAERFAVLVGINTYSHPSLPALKYAVQDVKDLAVVLRAGGYAVTMLNDDIGKTDASLAPTKQNIDAALAKVLRGAKAGDTVMVALCGHGIQFAREKDAYFCPSDARPLAEEPGTMVSASGLYRQFERSDAGVRVLLVDACRNDPSPGRGGIGVESVPVPRGVAALFSCAAGQRAYEHESLNHGVFFYYVLQGLAGEAANKDGVVTWGGLADYVGGAVPAKVLTLFPGQKLDQSPNAKADIIGMPPVLLTVKVPAVTPLPREEVSVQSPKPDANALGMKFRRIEPGTFVMGSPKGEKGRQNDEVQHTVTLTKPFSMAVRHVTRGQFAAFAKDADYKTDAEKQGWAYAWTGPRNQWRAVKGTSWRTPGFDQADDHPVVEVTWDDAVAFCQWLSRKEGKSYRLPTEAEFEYACRAGTKTAYFWGDDPDAGRGFAHGADLTLKEKLLDWPYATVNWRDGFAFTSPVGTFKPNPWGLYDMTGNAWEWCSDVYSDYPTGAVTNPTGPEQTPDPTRVLRGGAWSSEPVGCRSACRLRHGPGHPFGDVGFRVVLDSR